MLLPLEQSLAYINVGDKKNLFEAFCSRYYKLVFALLNKMIANYMKLILIYIRCFNFKIFFLRLIKYLTGKGLGF